MPRLIDAKTPLNMEDWCLLTKMEYNVAQIIYFSVLRVPKTASADVNCLSLRAPKIATQTEEMDIIAMKGGQWFGKNCLAAGCTVE